ncbi:hypothetical protein [Rhodococcus rhodochrous]|uniref:hypothetical protein n=1 Tax=Rhodococcus rhodochrous TaxID=1829 RepID=UPI00177FAB43|nr:hypothetical protein [Rhodococcus rhodochrous]QOH59873.1 hypothetical protein C6Y44_27675 [Rhodococcus rhodochrous]
MLQFGSTKVGRMQLGSVPLGNGWIWDDGRWKQVFSSRRDYRDDFNRTALGALWFDRLWTGTAPATIAANAVRAGTPTATSGINAQCQHSLIYTEPVATNDMAVEAVVVTTPASGYYVGVVARSDLAADNFVVLNAAGTAATAGIYSVVNGAFTRQVAVPTNAYVAGDTMILEAVGNEYTAKRRRAGVESVVASWTDTAGVTKVGPDYRHGGVYLVSVRNFLGTTYGPSLDNFAVYDKYVAPMVLRASDGFDGDGPLDSNWITTGGGTLVRANGRLDGTNTPSVPLSYAWWHEPMPHDTQQVEGVVRWDGRDPEHSACGLVVRADPFQDPVTNPGAQFGVQFSWTKSIMALYYEDYDAPNGFVPVTGVAQYVNTTKFPEGAVVTLRAEGNLYTARVNGAVVLQGTVADSVIPFSRRWVGATIQNDELVSGGGGPPGRIDDFKAFTP